MKNPAWVKQMDNELVTVHPLGGCYMVESIGTGVVTTKDSCLPKTSQAAYTKNFMFRTTLWFPARSVSIPCHHFCHIREVRSPAGCRPGLDNRLQFNHKIKRSRLITQDHRGSVYGNHAWVFLILYFSAREKGYLYNILYILFNASMIAQLKGFIAE